MKLLLLKEKALSSLAAAGIAVASCSFLSSSVFFQELPAFCTTKRTLIGCPIRKSTKNPSDWSFSRWIIEILGLKSQRSNKFYLSNKVHKECCMKNVMAIIQLSHLSYWTDDTRRRSSRLDPVSRVLKEGERFTGIRILLKVTWNEPKCKCSQSDRSSPQSVLC